MFTIFFSYFLLWEGLDDIIFLRNLFCVIYTRKDCNLYEVDRNLYEVDRNLYEVDRDLYEEDRNLYEVDRNLYKEDKKIEDIFVLKITVFFI